MAKIKGPLFCESASGALGGIEFRAGSYGPVVGRRSIASRGQTCLALRSQGHLIADHRAWAALSHDQRFAWSAWSKFPSTGRQTFMAMRSRTRNWEFPPLLTPRVHIRTDLIDDFSFLGLGPPLGSFALLWTPPGSATNWLRIFLLGSYSGRQSPALSKMVFLDGVRSNEGSYGTRAPLPAPVLHIRIDQVDVENGDLLRQNLLRVETGW